MTDAIEKNFTARNNADWRETIQFRVGDAPATISGSPRMTVRDHHRSVVLTLNVGAGLLFDADLGVLDISVSASQMSDLDAGVCTYDLQFRGAQIDVPIAGIITVSQGVGNV